MPLETATVPVDLNPLWPLGADPKSQGDDHLRMIKTVIQSMMPVGSVIMNNGANPAAIWGGTWVQIEGRMVIGVGTSTSADARTWALDEEDGNETHTLTEAELPAHTHDAGTLVTDTEPNHTHSYSASGSTPGVGWGDGTGTSNVSRTTGGAGSHNHDVTGAAGATGGDAAHNNLPPVVAKYIWERTA